MMTDTQKFLKKYVSPITFEEFAALRASIYIALADDDWEDPWRIANIRAQEIWKNDYRDLDFVIEHFNKSNR